MSAAAASPSGGECVKVCVRIRPLSSKEKEDGRAVCVTETGARAEIRMTNAASPEPRLFTFDYTFGENALQSKIYSVSASPIVESVLQGFNGTVFAYGQTGAGKTHTMEGLADPPEQRGIIPNCFKHIFEAIASNVDTKKQFLVRASYLEIYNEEIRDLLSKDHTARLELKENVDHEVYVKDLTAIVVRNSVEMDTVLQAGKRNRVTGETKMNATSSRSHAVFTITLETSEPGADGKDHIRVGKLNLVDLAGSERQSKTGATGQRLKEATKINQSLSALGNVISALVDGKSTHVPYRDSKLTRLLQDSLGGNTKTVMIANCGPADYNYDETLSTLRYADRAKQIRNKPRINEDPKDAMLREYQEEIARLRKMLEAEEKARAGSTTVIIDGREVTVPGAAAVERLAGASEEQMRALREAADAERSALLAKAEEERRALLLAAAKTDEERRKVEEQLEAHRLEAARALEEKRALEEQVAAMQAKLLTGGQVLDKAARQEEELRRAQIELEERRRQESGLARELEEANVMIEEQYASMAEELEAKTRKLKKVWHKLQAAQNEIRDLGEESQKMREDMLDSIREASKQLKLKQLLLDNFVPKEELERLEARAVWDDEADEWVLHRMELAGNRVRVRRPPSMLAASYTALFAALPMPQARPVSQHALVRAQTDSDPRFRADNIAAMDLEFSNFSAPPAEKLRVVANTRAVENVPGGGASGKGL